MKKSKMYLACSLSALTMITAISAAIQISANEVKEREKNNIEKSSRLPEYLVAIATPFISFDRDSNEFIINKKGLKEKGCELRIFPSYHNPN